MVYLHVPGPLNRLEGHTDINNCEAMRAQLDSQVRASRFRNFRRGSSRCPKSAKSAFSVQFEDGSSALNTTREGLLQ